MCPWLALGKSNPGESELGDSKWLLFYHQQCYCRPRSCQLCYCRPKPQHTTNCPACRSYQLCYCRPKPQMCFCCPVGTGIIYLTIDKLTLSQQRKCCIVHESCCDTLGLDVKPTVRHILRQCMCKTKSHTATITFPELHAAAMDFALHPKTVAGAHPAKKPQCVY